MSLSSSRPATRQTPNSQYLYRTELRNVLRHVTRWLDLGCGHNFLPPWMDEEPLLASLSHHQIVGVDLDRVALSKHQQLRLRVVGDVEQLPFGPRSFDLVTANMVLEHVHDPEHLFHEVGRVLAPGGSFLIHTPNASGYTTVMTRCVPASWRPTLARVLQGRNEQDVYHTYYRANTLGTLQALARVTSFQVAHLRTVASSAQLFRVPVIGWTEERLLRRLSSDRFERWRPCILGRLVKAA